MAADTPTTAREAEQHATELEQFALYADGDLMKKAMLDAARFLRTRTPSLPESAGEPVALDPLKGGCPYCVWVETNLGRVLDKKCRLHQQIEDMQVDLATERFARKRANELLDKITEIVGADPEDDLVSAVREIVDEREALLPEENASPLAPVAAMREAGNALAKAAEAIHPTAPSAASIINLGLAIEAWGRAASALPLPAAPEAGRVAGKMVVPTGWKLVPIEPTTAMLKAAQDAWLKDEQRRSSTLYRAMVSAAPSPSDDAGKGEER